MHQVKGIDQGTIHAQIAPVTFKRILFDQGPMELSGTGTQQPGKGGGDRAFAKHAQLG